MDKRKFYTIGPALNLCTRAFLYPTKLIKTRLQVQASGAGPKYTGMADALRKISESRVANRPQPTAGTIVVKRYPPHTYAHAD